MNKTFLQSNDELILSEIKKAARSFNPDNFSNMKVLLWLIFLISALISGCGSGNNPEEAEIGAKTPVAVIHINNSRMEEKIELNAVSSFLKKSTVKSTSAGIVESIEAELGKTVHKGDLLFTIKTKEATALEKGFPVDSSLHFKGLIKIFSSRDGIISSVSHHKGDYVQEGDELAIIAEQGSMIFLLEVPFEMRNFIRSGDRCDIILSDKQTREGKISSALPQMDIQSQTENYIVKPQFQEQLPENLIVRIQIVRVDKEHAMVLPREAVLTNEIQTEYWVMKLINDSIAVKIPVRKGIENAEKVEILDPVFKAEDRIVITGNYGMADTALVTIQK